MKETPSNLEGCCLIAGSHLAGSYFGKTIVLITHHEPGVGTLGLIFNRPTRDKVFNYLPKVAGSIGQTQIYDGGPVETKTLSIVGLHYEGNRLTLRTHLTPEQAEKFLSADVEGRQLRAYIGYAGWDAGQLENELARGDWRVLPLTPALLEPMDGGKLWQWAEKR